MQTTIISQEAIGIFLEKYPSLKGYDIKISYGDKNSISMHGKSIAITCVFPANAIRMLSFAVGKTEIDYCEYPQLKNVSYYIDCSRNGVLNFETFKKYVFILACSGYTTISLYTEDTYEVNNEPYFGHLRGRLSKEELKKYDAYAALFGMKLMPAIAVLAHLDNIAIWPEYEPIMDAKNIVMIDDERTYTLIDNMFATIAECFTCKDVHIGFDEAVGACLGRYYQKHGFVNINEALMRHLKRVLGLAKKHGLHCLMWSDMLFHMQYNEPYPSIDKPKFTKEVLDLIPKDVTLVYWDYYHDEQSFYEQMIDRHLEFGNDVAYAAGQYGWLGYAPQNQHAITNIIPAINACLKKGVQNVFLTNWADNGNECSRFSTLPSLFLFGEAFNTGVIDLDKIKERCRLITGVNYDDFIALDCPNEYGNKGGIYLTNPAKYLVYNDPLHGMFDVHISQEMQDYMSKCADKLSNIAINDDYKYIFDSEISLCDFFGAKANIGNDIYSAYNNKNISALSKIANERIPTIIEKLDAFILKLRRQWFKENKTFGFDALEIRLGGQRQRLIETAMRLNEFVNGEIEHIEELEIPKLSNKYPWEENVVYKHNYKYMAHPHFTE
ncbi:MAG: beta-N-acetylhexosaminidase [Clostridia bacterium]|nr:beta-N-acetylhexosaminidase [Clostridia bacterium]